jgi:hypothetical protein
MRAVVLRCENCGTTQDNEGECQACHEGQVKYYCTNHKPGRWLDGPVCSQCHAVYGRDEPPPAAPPQRPSRPPRAPPPASRKVEPEIRRPPTTKAPRDRPDPWVPKTPPTASRDDDDISEEALARKRMIEMLNELMRGGNMRGRMPPDPDDVPSFPPVQRIEVGWLGMALMFVLFLLLLFLM